MGMSARGVDNEAIEYVAKGFRLDLNRVVSRDTGRCECVCARWNGEERLDATVVLTTTILMIDSMPV